MKTLAKVISFAFHPLLFTTYLVLMLSWLLPRFLLIPPSAVWKFSGFVLMLTFAFPVANLFMLKAFGSISSLQMQDRKERIIPFVMITAFYAVVSAMFFFKVSGNINFNKIMLIVTCLMIVATVATFFFKVSVHSLAMGGALGILLPLNNASHGELLVPAALLFAVAGVVMSARLYLQAHSPLEVGYGAGMGFGVGYLGMILLF